MAAQRKHMPTPLRVGIFLMLILVGWLMTGHAQAGEASPAELKEIKGLLANGDFEGKERAINILAQSGDKAAANVLTNMLEGNLFYVKADKTIVVGTEQEGDYQIADAFTDAPLGSITKRKLKKVGINNRLRGVIKETLAKINLQHPDADVRLAAVIKMTGTLNDEEAKLVQEVMAGETDTRVRDAMATAIALHGLDNPNTAERLSALDEIGSNLNPAVRNRLQKLIGEENDKDVQKKTEQLLRSIDFKVRLSEKFETLFFGLSLGSVLVLAAIGLAITFGVIGVINMAHGELIMIGAYTTYVIQQLLPGQIGTSIFLAIPAAFIVSGLVGIGIEKSVIRFLYGRPLETLLATFGISLILQQAVRSIFSPLNRSVLTPAWMSGSIQLNPVLTVTQNRMYIFFFSLLVFWGLYVILKKTSIGLHVRAVSQNRAMARAMGVRASRVDALTFGLGSGIAGIAGVALSQITNVGPNLGQSYIVDSFMVVVFGGVGNLWGTLVAGLSLGVINKILEPWAGAVLAKILVLVFIILFIQKRPSGLFPQRGRSVEG